MEPHQSSRVFVGIGLIAAVATGAFANQALRDPPAPMVIVTQQTKPQPFRLPPRRALPKAIRQATVARKPPVKAKAKRRLVERKRMSRR